jgi:DNA polymerase-1
MADYQALRGDSVDNVPGVPGVGAKTAAALMGLFASLDELFAGLDAVAGLPLRGAAALPQRLRLHREAAYLARSLTRIVCDAPIDAATPELAAADLQRRAPDLERVAAFCDAHGFGTLLRRQAERLTRVTRSA